MKKLILILLAIFLVMSPVFAEDVEIDGLNLTTDIDEALDLSKTTDKPLAIVFDQESCVYCEILKDDVLTDSNVQDVLNEKFVVLFVDVNRNPELAAEYEIYGTPSIQFVSPDGDKLLKIEGCPETDELLSDLKEL